MRTLATPFQVGGVCSCPPICLTLTRLLSTLASSGPGVAAAMSLPVAATAQHLSALQLAEFTTTRSQADGSTITVVAPGYGSSSGSRLLAFDTLEVELFGFSDSRGVLERD